MAVAIVFTLIILFNLIMHKAARPSAPDEIPRAPLRPSFEMDKKTLTTSTFSGIPNRFIMTDR